jgi:hypothetical protein
LPRPESGWWSPTSTRAQRQYRLRPFKGLYLCFFVSAEHYWVLGRVKIQACYVSELAVKFLVRAELKLLYQMRLYPISIEYRVHLGMADAKAPAQLPSAEAGSVFGFSGFLVLSQGKAPAPPPLYLLI